MLRKEKLEELKRNIEELKTIDIIERNVKEENKFLQSKAYFFKLNNGKTIPREKLIKDGKDGSASIIVPIVNNEILTVIEPRVFTKLTVGVGFPAGYIENGEDYVKGAIRELKEETGYTPSKMIEIDSFYQDEGCSSALNHILVALNCKKVSEQSLDTGEFIKYMLFNYEELLELEQLKFIMGSNTKLALEKAKIYMKGNGK